MWLSVLRWVVLAAAVLPWIYYLLGIYSARRFFRELTDESAEFAPPVSILKPIHGLDRETYENFASFCRQEYPQYEILFGVNEENDPAIPIIQQLMQNFPRRGIRLLIGLDELGPNRKASKLTRLAREARYELLVISDSDIRVNPDYLRAVVAPFRSPKVGAVTCLYLGLTDGRVGSDLEAIGLSSDFAAGVLIARELEGVKFTLGATMATTRERLAEIGGFESMVDYCADDFELGNRIAARGYEVVVAPKTISTVFPSQSLADYFQHQFRWALSTRHSRPWGYLGMIFTHGLPWALVAGAASASARIAAGYLAGYLLFRLAMAWTVGIWGLRDPLLKRKLWLVPIRDAFAFVVWLSAFFRRRIRWRDQEFYLEKGRLIPKAPV